MTKLDTKTDAPEAPAPEGTCPPCGTVASLGDLAGRCPDCLQPLTPDHHARARLEVGRFPPAAA